MIRDIDQLCWDEWYHSLMYRQIREYLQDKTIKSCVDLGVGGGVFIHWALECLDIEKIVGFEPNPENFIFVHEKFTFEPRVTVYPYGIFYGVQWARVNQTGDNSPLGGMSGAIDTEHSDYYKATLRYYRDKIFHFVELEKYIDFMPDAIKIDVEGSEYNIIEHSNIVQNCPIIFLETHNHTKDWIEDYIRQHLPNHKIIFSQGGGIHFGWFLEQ